MIETVMNTTSNTQHTVEWIWYLTLEHTFISIFVYSVLSIVPGQFYIGDYTRFQQAQGGKHEMEPNATLMNEH